MKKYITLFLICLFNSAYGQVNIESIRNNKKESGFYNDTSVSAEFQRGNVKTSSLELVNRLDYHHEKSHTFLQLSGQIAEQSEKLFKNQAFSHLRFTNMEFGNIGYELFTQAQYNEFKNLKLRQLNGAGSRFVLHNKKENKMTIGLGIMTDYEIINPDQKNFTLRNTSYIAYNNTGKLIETNAVAYFQPSIYNTNDYRILTEASISSKLTNKLRLEVSINFNYDTLPPEGVLKNDLVIKNILKYIW